MTLQISENGRYLTYDDGSPFFYLGDTAWELFYRLDASGTSHYLKSRAAKAFTVIQAVLLSEFGALRQANAHGDLPLHDQDPTRPNEAFFEYVDWVVARAAELGLWIGLLPAWGDKVGPIAWGDGPIIFTPESAFRYGAFLGRRYAGQPVIWILGGDRLIETDDQRHVWRAMADGITHGDGGRGLMTFHPPGGRSSSELVAGEPWIDFFMIQTSHGARDAPTHDFVAADYQRRPTRPTMEAEWCYENHPVNWRPELGRFTDWDVRKGLYWSLFAGGHGFTYGCNDVFSFHRAAETQAAYDKFSPNLDWMQALDLPGAGQLRHARHLLESRPFLTRIPDQSLLVTPGNGSNHVRATRDEEGTYAMIYAPAGGSLTVDPSCLTPGLAKAWWFDPRTGTASAVDVSASAQPFTVTSPTSGPEQDWVLVLDADVSRPMPGSSGS